MVKSLNYNGLEVEYEDSVLGKWSFMRKMTDPVHSLEAADALLCNKSDQVAEKLGDSFEEMGKLIERILVVEGKSAKN